MSQIQEIRELTGMSLTQVGSWLGLSRSMIFLVQKGKRHLSSDALFKLSAMVTQLRQLRQTAKTGRVEISDPFKLADLHRGKMEKHRGFAASLQKQLDNLQQEMPKVQSRQALFDVMKEIDIPGHKRNPGDNMIIEILELESKKPTDLQSELELLQDKIDTHLAYAQLHQERWGMYVEM